jgi:hypothetical protein
MAAAADATTKPMQPKQMQQTARAESRFELNQTSIVQQLAVDNKTDAVGNKCNSGSG